MEKQKQPKYYTVDAAGKPFGRVASEVALLLRGKREVDFTPNKEPNVRVALINLSRVRFSGNKKSRTVQHRFTGYPGGIRTATLGALFAKNPIRLFERAVLRMLPKNRLQKQMRKRMTITL